MQGVWILQARILEWVAMTHGSPLISAGSFKLNSEPFPLNFIISAFRVPLSVSSVQLLGGVRLFATHGLQHTRLPDPSPTPGVCSNSCPSSRWCHPTISSSVVPFSSCLQSFLESGSFLVSQFIESGGQSIGASASASVLQWIFRTDFL